MKLVVIVGSEGHTSSSASLRIEYGDTAKGVWERTPKEWQQGRMQKPADAGHEGYAAQNSNWWLLTLDVPAGMRLRYSGTGRTGARGANKHEFSIDFRLDEAAEIQEETPDVGLVSGYIKGRLKRTVLAPKKVDPNEGF